MCVLAVATHTSSLHSIAVYGQLLKHVYLFVLSTCKASAVVTATGKLLEYNLMHLA